MRRRWRHGQILTDLIPEHLAARMISSGAAVGRVPCERCRVVMLQVNGPGAPTPPRRPNYIPQCARAHTSPLAPPRARAYTCKKISATITHNFKAYYEY